MISHVVFDCDGVLVDSEPLSMAVDHELLHEHGLPLTRAQVMRLFIGHTFGELVAIVARDFGVVLPPGIEAEKDRRLFQRFTDELKAVEGVARALERSPLPRSIASNSSKARVSHALALTALDKQFGGRITTYEDAERGKPAPDVYLIATGRAGFAPWECLAVEDSVAGVTSAARAGLKVVGFTGAYHDAEGQERLLREAGAHTVIAHMDALEAAIAAFSAAPRQAGAR